MYMKSSKLVTRFKFNSQLNWNTPKREYNNLNSHCLLFLFLRYARLFVSYVNEFTVCSPCVALLLAYVPVFAQYNQPFVSRFCCDIHILLGNYGTM